MICHNVLSLYPSKMAYTFPSLPRTVLTTHNKKCPEVEIIHQQRNRNVINLSSPSIFLEKNGGLLRASSSEISLSTPELEENDCEINKEMITALQDKDEEFDHAAPPPFTLAEIRAVIPKHCWVKDTWRSLSYVVRDVVVVFALAGFAASLNSWFVWPLYWFAQGTMLWAFFAIGHDCEHGSFSDHQNLNTIVGHLVHTAILVPYHGMRISHKKHHQNQGHAEKDESWHPWPEKLYRSVDNSTRLLRFTPPFPLFAYPFYLFMREPGKKGSHFHPGSDLFAPSERKDVITSSLCWGAMVALLIGLCFVLGPLQMLKHYGIPYLIFVVWLDLVTYLNHHGHGEEERLPWYRGKEWNYLRGALTTLDRDYGWFNNIHHDIGTHVIHHLFPQIPHYHLVEATKAVKPILGKYYKEPKKSGPIPLHLIGSYLEGLKHNHFVSDTGDIVYYQTDPYLYGSSKSK